MSYSFEQVSQLVNKLKKMGWDSERVTALGQANTRQFRAIEEILDGKNLGEAIRAAMKVDVVGRNTSYSRLLSGAEALLLPACDGTRTIARASDVFRSFINSRFTNWGLDVTGVATPTTEVQVHEQVKDGDFRQMFTSLSSDLDRLCMSQHQIIVFCKNHHQWLKQGGWSTFFLFKKEGKFFVADVGVHSNSLNLGVGVELFDKDDLWFAKYCLRLVSPQLESENLGV